MATTIKQIEGIPEAYPDAPSGLSTAAAALDADAIWQRIEVYIAHRFTSRSIEWIVVECGDWQPPLAPATISTVERWNGSDWETATALPSPVGGYCLPGGSWRFTGTVGGGSVPEIVNEAFRRLAEYMAAAKGAPGTTRERVTAGSVTVDKSRSASWAAASMANSGAGDLLRNYRRA
ncbi:MAG: hypothetical protein WBA88_22660 [Pseudaminobacter sp.]